jgi:ABC-type multidrug transport system ATPase subunit
MELLDWIGLSHRAHDAVKTFSRGMTQRVAIARALMHEPDLLLADEPFAGLDAPSADMLQNMLRHLHAAGCTVILANHDISQTLELAKRVLVLRDGRIAVDSAAKQHDARSLLQEVAGT